MAFADIDTAYTATKAAGDFEGKIIAGLTRRAVSRLGSIGNNEGQREAEVCRQIIVRSYPATWVLTVMERLDFTCAG